MTTESTGIQRDLTRQVAGGGELSGLDKKLLELASRNMSPDEIGKELNLKPARAAQRIREILRERDWLSLNEQEAMLMQDLIDLKNFLTTTMHKDQAMQIAAAENAAAEAREDADFGLSRNYEQRVQELTLGDPRWAANLKGVLAEIGKILNGRRKIVESDRLMIRNSTAILMAAAIEMSFKNLVYQVREEYPEVDELKMRNMIEQSLPRAFQAIEERTEL